MKRLKENKTGEKALYLTKLNIKTTSKYLIAKFVCKNCSCSSFSDKYNDDLFKGDVVELFISVGKENKYYEIEVSPNNTVFLAEITNINGDFKGDRLKENFVESKVRKIGTTLIYNIRIGLDKINYDKEKGIEFNAFRIETDGERSEKHLFALFPTLCGSFHVREAFKKL